MSQTETYRGENTALTSGAHNKENTALTHGAHNKENTGLTSGAPNKEGGKMVVRAEVKHNRLRRKEGHDYAAPGIYLITVTTTDRQRILGELMGASPAEASIQPTTLGEYVIAAFRKMAAMVTEKTGSRIQVYQYQLMPDHFHGILRIHDALPEGWHLSRMIGAWKGDCSREYWRLNAALTRGEPNKEGNALSSAPDVRPERESLFSPGYNDKILFHKGQLQTWYEYLHDNPRRLWLKVHYPDRLRKIYDFKAGKQGHSYTAVGNTFLVRYPERIQVRCHRNLTEEQIQAEVEHYMSLARGGAVLVSPFISPAEKAVYEAAYKEELPIIRIVNRGLDGKFIYPTGRDLKGCSAGFMLVLAPYADYSAETAETRITRSQCLDMNGYAADLSTTLALTHEVHNKESEHLSGAPDVRPENINTEAV